MVTSFIRRNGVLIAMIAALIAVGGGGVQTAWATPIQLVAGSINMFRDIRAANDVGIAQGDRFQFGADIVGGSAGTTIGAVYGPDQFTVTQHVCGPLAVDANFCSRTVDTANVLGATTRLAPWTLTFQRVGETSLQMPGPPLAGADAVVPFPSDVTISGAGLTPTISWTIPNSFVPNGFRVQIFDRDQIIAGTTQADVVFSRTLQPSATSFTFTAGLLRPDGTPVLQPNGHYTINFQVIETRLDAATADPNDRVPFSGNPSILVRSSSFFDFSPLAAGAPPDIALPTIVNGVYNFNVPVMPSTVTFIDPLVATGYIYATGAGDPNFASVLLPTGIGDNLFDLLLWNGTAFVDDTILTGGAQFFFGGTGVDRFEILGIETSAGLDPGNPTAFVTGLTFVSAGNFTGTMTPVTVNVAAAPEPSTLLLVLLAMTLLARKRIAGHLSAWQPFRSRPQGANRLPAPG